jgi:dipeptidyl-peptidase-4
MKNILYVFTLCLCTHAFSQKQTLTLEQAIMGRWSKFNPERLNNLQWISGTNLFCYIEENSLIIENQEGPVKNIHLSKINKFLAKDSLSAFPPVNWLNESDLRFTHNQTIYIYDIEKNSLTNWGNYPKSGQNFDFSNKAMALAYTQENNLFIQDSNGKTHPINSEENPNTVFGQAVHRYEFGISKGTFWSNSGNYLAFYSKDESMVTDYPLVNTSGRIAEANIIKYPMAGMNSHHVSLGLYNLKTEKTVFVQTGEPKEQYLTNICWGPDDKFIYIALLNRNQNQMKLNQYDAKTGSFLRTLFEETHENYVQPLHPMLFIKDRSGEFLWRSERDGFDHFYRYNIQGDLLNQVSKGKWVVKEFVAFNGNEIIFTGTSKNGLETHIFKSPLDSSRSAMISKKEGIHSPQANKQGDLILDSYNSIKNSGSVDLINSNGKKIKNLFQSKDPFENTLLGKTELFSIKTQDNTLLNCRMIKPKDFDPNKKYPCLVYVYNGPGVQLIYNSNLASASLWMHYMANEYDYIVFTIDGRGSENRGQEFEQAIFRNLGQIEMLDQLLGVNHLKSLKYIDPNKIAVHGWSYGGFMTTNLLCSYPDVFTCGVAGGPVINWKYYEVMYTERFMDTPEINPEGYKNSNLLNKAKNLKNDLLIIHGTQDDVVVWQHSLAFVEECVSAGIQIDYFPYPGHTHNVRGKDRIHLMRKIIDYIVDHNN